MLGCQDFCGYYEWTFHFLRRKFGPQGVEKFWREAIAADAQSHYIAAGQRSALRGLYDCWSHTGDSEKCDWTVALDEGRNHLRLDMRECPSKGFLLKNDLNADEDYCDHCIGWIGPALEVVNAQVIAHEHNHCGQCWWQIGVKSKASTVPELPADIRLDPRWQFGYVDRFEHHKRTTENSGSPGVSWDDAISMLFAGDREVLILGDGFTGEPNAAVTARLLSGIVTDRAYLNLDPSGPQPCCILLGYDSAILNQVAKRWGPQSGEKRPQLLHAFLPGSSPVPFKQLGLPRPIPILPLLIQKAVYVHRPRESHPSTSVFAFMLGIALNKDIVAAGIARKDLEQEHVIADDPHTRSVQWLE